MKSNIDSQYSWKQTNRDVHNIQTSISPILTDILVVFPLFSKQLCATLINSVALWEPYQRNIIGLSNPETPCYILASSTFIAESHITLKPQRGKLSTYIKSKHSWQVGNDCKPNWNDPNPKRHINWLRLIGVCNISFFSFSAHVKRKGNYYEQGLADVPMKPHSNPGSSLWTVYDSSLHFFSWMK